MARNHFEAGRTYFERARYEDAHREFAEAYRLSQRPTLLLNMSRAREAAGDPAGAAECRHRAAILEKGRTRNRAAAGLLAVKRSADGPVLSMRCLVLRLALLACTSLLACNVKIPDGVFTCQNDGGVPEPLQLQRRSVHPRSTS